MQFSMFSSEERPASPSRSPDCERDSLTRVATWPSSILLLLHDIGPVGWFGRTSPASCHRRADGILVPSSEGWGSSGMGGPTESLTLNTCEWTGWSGPSRSDDGVCSL